MTRSMPRPTDGEKIISLDDLNMEGIKSRFENGDYYELNISEIGIEERENYIGKVQEKIEEELGIDTRVHCSDDGTTYNFFNWGTA